MCQINFVVVISVYRSDGYMEAVDVCAKEFMGRVAVELKGLPHVTLLG